MTLAAVLYAVLFSASLAVVANVAERASAPFGIPRRLVWAICLLASVITPAVLLCMPARSVAGATSRIAISELHIAGAGAVSAAMQPMRFMSKWSDTPASPQEVNLLVQCSWGA